MQRFGSLTNTCTRIYKLLRKTISNSYDWRKITRERLMFRQSNRFTIQKLPSLLVYDMILNLDKHVLFTTNVPQLLIKLKSRRYKMIKIHMGCPMSTVQVHSKHYSHLIAYDAGWLLFLVFPFCFCLLFLESMFFYMYMYYKADCDIAVQQRYVYKATFTLYACSTKNQKHVNGLQ